MVEPGKTPPTMPSRAACSDSGISLIDVPTGLKLDARVGWVAARLVDLGLVGG